MWAHIPLQRSKTIRFGIAEQPASDKRAGFQKGKMTEDCP